MNSNGRQRAVTNRSPPRSRRPGACVSVAVPVRLTETTSRSEWEPFNRAGVVTRLWDEFRDVRRRASPKVKYSSRADTSSCGQSYTTCVGTLLENRMTSATASARRPGGRPDASRTTATARRPRSVSAEGLDQRPKHVQRRLLGRRVRGVELVGIPDQRHEVLAGERGHRAQRQPLGRLANLAQRDVKDVQRNHEIDALAALGELAVEGL